MTESIDSLIRRPVDPTEGLCPFKYNPRRWRERTFYPMQKPTCAKCLMYSDSDRCILLAVGLSTCGVCCIGSTQRHCCSASFTHADISKIKAIDINVFGARESILHIASMFNSYGRICQLASSLIIIGIQASDALVEIIYSEHFKDCDHSDYVYSDIRTSDLCQDLCSIAVHILSVHSVVSRSYQSVWGDTCNDEMVAAHRNAVDKIECIYMQFISHHTMKSVMKVMGTTCEMCVSLLVRHSLTMFKNETPRWHVFDFFRSSGTTLHGKDTRPTGLPISHTCPVYKNGSLGIVHVILRTLTKSTATEATVMSCVTQIGLTGMVQFGYNYFWGSTRGYPRDLIANLRRDDPRRKSFLDRSTGNILRTINSCISTNGVAAVATMVRLCDSRYLAPTASSTYDDMIILQKLAEGTQDTNLSLQAIRRMLRAGVTCTGHVKCKGPNRGRVVPYGGIHCVVAILLSTTDRAMLDTLLADEMMMSLIHDHLIGGCPAGFRTCASASHAGCSATRSYSTFSPLVRVAAELNGNARVHLRTILCAHRAYLRTNGMVDTPVCYFTGHKYHYSSELPYYRVFAPEALRFGVHYTGDVPPGDMLSLSIFPLSTVLAALNPRGSYPRMKNRMLGVYHASCHTLIENMSAAFVHGHAAFADVRVAGMLTFVLNHITDGLIPTNDMLQHQRECADIITYIFTFFMSVLKCSGASSGSGADNVLRLSAATGMCSNAAKHAIAPFHSLCSRIGLVICATDADFFCGGCKPLNTLVEYSIRAPSRCDWRCAAHKQAQWVLQQMHILSRDSYRLLRYSPELGHGRRQFYQRFLALDYTHRRVLYTMLLVRQRACCRGNMYSQAHRVMSDDVMVDIILGIALAGETIS